MNRQKLQPSDVLLGYDSVSQLYPYVPPLSHWRAWEYAAYQQFELTGRVLDLGCGDGRYFKLLWPEVTDVVGVDMDNVVAALGQQSGVYRQVHVASAHQIPEPDQTFDYIFANCSLEHMDKIDLVLAEVHRCLKPGGAILCSVVTERFLQWSLLENLIEMAGFDDVSKNLRKNFSDFHNLVNPLPVEEWEEKFVEAGLKLKEHIPILPQYNSGIFLLMDSLWHVPHPTKVELGKVILPFLSGNNNFPSAFRKVLEGVMEMESNWSDCSGAVFLAVKE